LGKSWIAFNNSLVPLGAYENECLEL
jgi:hypothetical protein